MPTNVVMPQMGESIAEGTIVRWIKRVGDAIERDEPLFEISTDKVDAEIPSPIAGVVAEIRHKEGETVPVNTVVAVIADRASAPAPAPSAPAQSASGAPSETQAPPPPAPKPQADGAGATAPPAAASAPPASAPPPPPAAVGASSSAPPHEEVVATTTEERIRQRSSPLVRRIAKEHQIDISTLSGSGIAGRVTKNDIMGVISGGGAQKAAAPATVSQPAKPAPSKPAVSPVAGTSVPMTVMRKKIAEHMLMSRRTSAHVHSVFEVNFHRVDKIRVAKKAEYERAGGKLTYLAFILKAVADGLRAVPVVNASVEGDNIVYHKHVNIGIAVALDWGLIVPVVKNADEKNLLGISHAVTDLANRARAKQLKPDEVAGGTFTVTNPGTFGALFGMPIISQPQVAILGVGNIEKRPVVIDDAIAIRPMGYLSIGYDHRIIDGAVADEFMSHVKRTLENWDPAQA